MPHHQPTTYERYLITHLHQAGFGNADIGRRLGRHRATVGRELSRNPKGLRLSQANRLSKIWGPPLDGRPRMFSIASIVRGLRLSRTDSCPTNRFALPGARPDTPGDNATSARRSCSG